jgi:hypothetical protein
MNSLSSFPYYVPVAPVVDKGVVYFSSSGVSELITRF